METKEIRKNLKHGYIFLSVIVLVLFGISVSVEIYLKGGFKFNLNNQTLTTNTDNSSTTNTDNPEVLLEFQNITDGYKTKDSTITIVAKTNIGNKAWINGKEATVNETGVFELKVDLVVGSNEITIEAENQKKGSKKVSIIREEEPKPTSIPAEKPKEQPIIQPKPETIPTVKLEPTPVPQPNPVITALKLHCSISNTQPAIGQTVNLDCTVKDQNNNPINGLTGNATVNWQSGVLNYNFPTSNNGNTQVGFAVPAGNKGSISGSVRISKDGLTVNSNFSITVL